MPVGNFVVRFGGHDAATVSSLMELFGFVVSTGFVLLGTGVSEYGWRWAWLILLPVIVTGTVLYYFYNVYNLSHEVKEENQIKGCLCVGLRYAKVILVFGVFFFVEVADEIMATLEEIPKEDPDEEDEEDQML